MASEIVNSINYHKGGMPEIWVLRKTDSTSYDRREIRITDEIPDLPADDDSVMGKWNVCDLVSTIDGFDPQNPFFPSERLYWIHTEFLKGGAILNSTPYMDLPPSVSRQESTSQLLSQ